MSFAEKVYFYGDLLWRYAQADDPSRLDEVEKIREWAAETLFRARALKRPARDVELAAERTLKAVDLYVRSLPNPYLHRDLVESLTGMLNLVLEAE